MKNKDFMPAKSIKQFLIGDLSVSEEKALLDWIDETPLNMDLFLKEQDKLRLAITQRKKPTVSEQWGLLNRKIRGSSFSFRKKSKNPGIGIRFSAIAAAVMFGLIFYLLLNKSGYESQPDGITKVVHTVPGEKTNFVLPDGTKVTLNSRSKLTYPKEFYGDFRDVKLYGEAFFEVSPDPGKPFIVHTRELNVRVLGTEFDLKAFPDENEISTTLVHGKVRIEKEDDGEIIPLADITASERAVYNTDNKKIDIRKAANLEQYIGWKEGKLVFMNASIEEIAQKLELWYNVSVNIQNENLKKAHFTMTFTNESIEQVLRLLKISYPINYTIKEINKNITDKNSPELEITLSSK